MTKRLRDMYADQRQRAQIVSEMQRGPVVVYMRRSRDYATLISIVGASVSPAKISLDLEHGGAKYRPLCAFLRGVEVSDYRNAHAKLMGQQ